MPASLQRVQAKAGNAVAYLNAETLCACEVGTTCRGWSTEVRALDRSKVTCMKLIEVHERYPEL